MRASWAAQIDRFANLNSTVIGDYATPRTRLPGAGGAPEIAAHARETFIILKQSARTFVPKLDFCSTAGFMEGSGARARSGATGLGPRAVITDLGILKPAAGTQELTLVERYDGVSVEEVVAATGWPLKVADQVGVVAPPTAQELKLLRELHARTRAAHNRPAILRALKRLP